MISFSAWPSGCSRETESRKEKEEGRGNLSG